MFKKMLSCLVCAFMVISSVSPIHAETTTTDETATGTYKIAVDGYDWGPAVSKAILSLDKAIDSVDKGDLLVKETKNSLVNFETMETKEVTTDRKVVNIYLSDENGNAVTNPSKHVTVEMKVDPNTGSPFIYTGMNKWTDPYYLTFEFDAGKQWKSGTKDITTLALDQNPTGKNMGLADQFNYEKHATSNGTSYSYASYEPQGKNLPLIIWLNGAGEGGSDPTIVTLGNRVTGLIEKQIQDAMGGSAYVFAPQCPTIWMEGYDFFTGNGGESIYTESLMELIEWYVKSHPEIDTDRIYIGGCSNGGYMTMQMITTYPTYFAAAYPICSAYLSKDLTDEKLAAIKDLPIWFTHAKNDPVVDPEATTIDVYNRLQKMGASNIHLYNPADVRDTSGLYKDEKGNPYQYNGHWSWIYAFNNESVEGDLELFEWLGQQNKSVETTVAKGTQSIVVEGFDWGPAVTKTIVSLDMPIDSISASQLDVIESKYAMDWTTMTAGTMEFNRTVTNAYLSDVSGNPVNGASAYVTIEMAVSPNDGSPFFYDVASGFNSWTKPYDLIVTLKDGVSLVSGDKYVTSLRVNPTPTSKDLTKADLFEEGSFTSNDQTLKYASFAPAKDNGQNPLIIWLHGAGEGGTDTTIATLGNKITTLVSDEIQGIMKGAYVLAPQAPTMWMDDGDGYTTDGKSIYTEVLMALIEDYVDSHPDIDPNRVYIGGCSNGGFMTMNMVLHYPEYFAAAFPICEAYDDSWITDEMLEGIKDLPIWFTHAKNDPVVDPNKTILPTYDRLVEMGANNIHRSYFDDVHDTSGKYFMPDGTPYQYNGHWSWIYTLNNECVENDVTIFEWLSQQAKPVIKDDDNVPDTGDKNHIVAFGGLAVLSLATGYLVLKKKKEN